MKFSNALVLLLATSYNVAVATAADAVGVAIADANLAIVNAAVGPISLRGGMKADVAVTDEPDRLPVGGTCCNCINVVGDFDCLEWGENCVRCETFSTQEGEHTLDWNFQSSGAVDGNIYYPQEGSGPWPVISFGHGFGNRDLRTDKTRRNLFIFMVQQGFVVVAHREEHQAPAANYKAQLDVLDWLYQSQFSHFADQSRTLMMGHSMGGRGTLKNVADPATVEKYNVKASIAMHPWCWNPCQGGSADCGIPLVPTLWVTGNEDFVANNDIVYTHYVAQVLSDKVFIERDGMGHNFPDNFLYDNDASMENTFKAFVDCEMFDAESACVSLFGEEDISDKLGSDGNGIDLGIERDENATGFFQPWRGEGYFPEAGSEWVDPLGYSRTEGYRLTTGSMSCTSSRDCKGRNDMCLFECKNPVFCGKANWIGISNCEQCLAEPNYPEPDNLEFAREN